MARGFSRVLYSAAVGAKTPNSGGRAAPVHHCPRWLSKPKKGLGGDIRLLLITSLKCVSVTNRPKTFVRSLTSLLLQLRTPTAHRPALWVWLAAILFKHGAHFTKSQNRIYHNWCSLEGHKKPPKVLLTHSHSLWWAGVRLKGGRKVCSGQFSPLRQKGDAYTLRVFGQLLREGTLGQN